MVTNLWGGFPGSLRGAAPRGPGRTLRTCLLEPRVEGKGLRWTKRNSWEFRMKDVDDIVPLKGDDCRRDTEDSRTVPGNPNSSVFLSDGHWNWLIPAAGEHRLRYVHHRDAVWKKDRRDHKVPWENRIMDKNLNDRQRPGCGRINDFRSFRIPAAAICRSSPTVICKIPTGVQSINFSQRTPCSRLVRTDRT